MADDRKKRGHSGQQAHNVNDQNELRNWAKSSGTTPEQIKAVAKVGTSADKVREHLAK